MRRLTISTFLVGIMGALALGLLLFSGGQNAQAVTGTSPDGQTITGQINQVSVDMDTTDGGGNGVGTGNGAVVGPVTPVIGGVPLSGSQTVDVIIDEIAAADGLLSGFQFQLLYAQSVVNVTAESATPYMIGPAGSQVGVTPPCPSAGLGCLATGNATGDLLLEWAHLDGSGTNFGEGILVRLTIKCVGASPGFSPLTLVDTIPGGDGSGHPRIYTTVGPGADPSAQYPINNVNNGTIYCGEPAPSVSDLQVNNTTVTPNPGIAGSNFNVLVDANVQNNGPTGPTKADVNETLVETNAAGVPLVTPDCTIAPPAMPVVIAALAFPPGAQAVPQQTFVVNCAHTSFHHFTSTATISVDPTDNPPHIDNVAANDSATSVVATTAVTATADPAIVGASTSSSAPSQCLPQSPPAPGCATAPVVTIGANQTVTVHKVLQNLSGYSPVPVSDLVVYVGALQEPSGNPATCTVTPLPLNPQTVTLTGTGVASQQTLNFQFTANCTTNSFYDSHNPQQIYLLFQDVLSMNDPDNHITDSDQTNNAAGPFPLAFWNRAPFTPAFTETISSTQGPDSNTVLPSTHQCVTNLALPVAGVLGGIPCEMYQTTAIPAGNPLALATTITPPTFSIANGLTIPDNTPSAYFGFLLNLDGSIALGGPPSVCNIPVGASGVLLVDGALPSQGTNPGTTLAGLTDPFTYPLTLNADPVVASLLASPAVLWARYVGTAPIPGNPTAVNILVFNAGPTGWITATVTGEPSPPGPATPVGEQCTPFNANVDFLGSTPGNVQTLRTCDTVGVAGAPGGPNDKTFLANWVRADTFETYGPSGTPPTFIPGVTMDVTNSCTPSDTSVTMTKNETLPGPGTSLASAEVDTGITYNETVSFNVVGSSDLKLSLVGPAICNPHWTNPLDSFPSNIAGVQTSLADLGVVGPGTVTATYSFNCAVAGNYTFQVVANLTPVGSENTANNQAENHVQIHAVQNLCNGVPNNLCQCLTGPVDPEGNFWPNPDPSDTFVSNGCPDTNISIGPVVKEENYNVDVSVDTTKHVDITVNNSEYPADVLVHILAVSKIGQCEVRLAHTPGDPHYSEFSTTEPPALPGDPANTLNSQLELTIPNMPVGSVVLHIDYIIHCFQKSDHTWALGNGFELQVDAVPMAPIVEENLGGDPILDPTNPNNNVYKNFPTVHAWEQANLNKTCDALATTATPTQGTDPFTITSTCHVTNLGPYGLPSGTVTYSDNVTFSMPIDCHISGTPVLATGGTLNGSTPGTETSTWTVHCDNPSFHVFTANDTIALTGPIHVYDPCPNPPPGPVPGPHTICGDNNSSSSSVTVAIHTTTDASVTNALFVSCSPGTTVNVGQTITCTENETVALGLATGGTLTSTLSVPADCVVTSPNPITGQAAVNGINAASFSFSCSSPSDHNISKTVCLTPTLPLHVTETNTANNCTTAAGTVVILAHATLAIPPFLPAPGEIEVGQPPSLATINASATVTVTGDPVTVSSTISANGTGDAPCSVDTTVHSGTAYAFGVTLPNGHECTYQICVTASATGVHEIATPVTLCQPYSLQSNVLVAKYCLDVGPAAVNLSDTNGRYMWVICEIGNVTAAPEPVTISMTIDGPVPAGCTRISNLVLPGQTAFTLGAHEQKMIVYRVRYECHAPATGVVINQTTTFTVTHVDDGVGAHDIAADVETILSDNTKTTTKQVIIQ